LRRTCLLLSIASLWFVAFSIGLNPTALAEVVTKSCLILNVYEFDVDTLKAAEDAYSGDLWLHNSSNTEMYLIPNHGAQLADLGIVDYDSIINCSLYTLSTDWINVSRSDYTIPTGTVLVVKTNIGRYAKMRIDDVPSWGILNVTVAYQNDGTPILPEAPTILLLPLFVTATLLTVVFHRKKKKE
jgi:hypothetical protein